MSALGIIGLVVLAVVLALLFLPFRARAFGSVHDASPQAVLSVDFAWGFAGVDASLDGTALRFLGARVWRFGPRTAEERRAKREKRKARKAAKQAKGEKKQQKERKGVIERLRAGRGHTGALVAMLRRLVRTLHVRLAARGVIGTGDPADTALLFATVRALQEIPGLELELWPEWLEEEVDVDAQLGVCVWLSELIVVALGLLLVRENRSALRAMRAAAA